MHADTRRVNEALAAATAAGLDLNAELTVTIRPTLKGVAQYVAGTPAGHRWARAGDTVTMPRSSAIRLEVLGVLAGTVDDAPLAGITAEEELDLAALDGSTAAGDPLAALIAGDDELEDDEPAGDTSTLTTEELVARNAPELVAHLGRFAGDRERVKAAELAGKARTTVLAACDPPSSAE